MSYIINGKPVKNVGIITEPSSYGTDITPEDMQSGRTAVSKGKIVTGTGRAFEFARYGRCSVDVLQDENNNDVYGAMLKIKPGCNIVFMSSIPNSDIFVQSSFVFNISDSDEVVGVAMNQTTLSDVYAFYRNDYLYVYSAEIANPKTTFNYFVGKDNLL